MTKSNKHLLDDQQVPRCGNCLHQGRQCVDRSIPRKWGQAVDYCGYYTTLRHDLPVPRR